LSAIEEERMNKYLIAAVVITSFAAQVFAAEAYFIMYDTIMKNCTIMTAISEDKERYKMMGKYASEAAARSAMAEMKDCY
jgi:hypothetical protein